MNEENIQPYGGEDRKERADSLSLSMNNLQEIGGAILIAFAFLVPIFFIPSSVFNFTAGKMLLLIVFVLVTLLLAVMFLLKKGRIDVPKHPLLIAALSVPAAYLVSGILSVSGFTLSVAGYGSETYTFTAVLFFFLLFFLTLFFFQKNAYVFYFYLAVVASSLVLGLFFLFRFILGVEFLSLGFFNVKGASPLESWTGVGILFGIVFILSLFAFETLKMKAGFRWVLGVTMALSFFFLLLTGIVWYWVAIAAVLILFIFHYMIDEKRSYDSGVPFLSVVTLFIAIAFIFFGSPLSGVLSQSIGVASDDLRPSFSATAIVAKSTVLENPLRAVVGAGPLDFSYQWMQHKPEGIMASRFWNVEFGQGYSMFASVPITTGLLGIAAWLAFIGLFLVMVFRGFFHPFSDVLTRYIFISSVCVSILLLVAMSMTLIPLSLLALFFMFASIPVGVLVRERKLAIAPVEFKRSTQTGSIYMITAIIVAGTLLLFGAFILQRSISGVFFEKSARAFFAEGDINSATSNFEWAVSLSEQDRFYRVSAEFPIALIRRDIGAFQRGEMSQEDFLQRTAVNFRSALQRAQKAINLKDAGYRNWLALGSIYQEMLAFNFTDVDAYDGARKAYDEALKRNPKNPALFLQIARIELIKGNIEEARRYNDMALEIKPNYANAIFFTSQVAMAEGNLVEAERSVTQALSLEPFDAGLYFQRGILRYERDDMAGAANDFNRAITLAPRFDNARYFLSLSLYRTGEDEVASQLMEELVRRYEQTPQLSLILDNMRTGETDPLRGVAGFEEPTPQLPIEEEIPGIDLEEDELLPPSGIDEDSLPELDEIDELETEDPDGE